MSIEPVQWAILIGAALVVLTLWLGVSTW